MREFTLQKDGDPEEVTYGKSIVDEFPNYEIFWQKFIVPWTNRDILKRSDMEGDYVSFKHEIPEFIEELCMVHYSVFRDLTFFIKYKEELKSDSLRSIYAHFGHALDMSRDLAVKIIIIGKELGMEKYEDVFSNFPEGEKLIERFKKYIEGGDFSKARKEFINKQKPVLYFVQGARSFWKDLVNDLAPSIVADLDSYFKEVMNYRSTFIHSPVVGTLFLHDAGGNVSKYAIKKDKINNYKHWSAVKKMENREDFILEDSLLSAEFTKMKGMLNILWEGYIKHLTVIYKNPELIKKLKISTSISKDLLVKKGYEVCQ